MAKVTKKSTSSGAFVDGLESSGPYGLPFEFGSGITYIPPVLTQTELDDMGARRQAAMNIAGAPLTTAMGQVSALEGSIESRRAAEQSSIQQARKAAARAMFGQSGGLGGLAGSGAVRASLSQSGMDRALAEGAIRSNAQQEIQGYESELASARGAVQALEPQVTEDYLGRAAVEEFMAEWQPQVWSNIGEDDDARRRMAESIMAAARHSEWEEVHRAAYDLAKQLLQEI